MFSDNNYQKFIYSNVTNNYQYTYAQNPTYQLSYPIYQEEKLYQEDINKCLSNVNNDYNSYDASLPFDDCSYTNVFNKDVNSLRDSGNESEFYEDSVSHVGTKEQSHTHQSSDEQDKCSLCHKTSAFLLSTPFINYFDFKFSSSNLNISLTSDEINYDEYKPFDNFTFATPTKTRLNNSLLSQLISPSDLQNDLKEIQMDFEFNGKIIGKKDRLKSCSVNDINRLFPAQQNLDTCDFQPTVVSTPSKYLQNQQYYQLSGKNINNNQQSQMETSYNSSFSWKKAIVLDPRLSASYDAVFPSLEVSFNSDCTKQSTNLNTTTENFEPFHCAFCKNNKESPDVYLSHILRDSTGRVCCPILRNFICPICGNTGDIAHTRKYCPMNQNAMVHFKTQFYVPNLNMRFNYKRIHQ